MNKKYALPVLLFSFLFYACNPIPIKVTEVLDHSSNRIELEKVIEHYKQSGEKEKLNASYYLIQNLPQQYHYEGEGVDQYKQMFSQIKCNYNGKGLRRTWDSLKVQFNGFPAPVNKTKDLNALNAAYLIQHIDAVFKSRIFPWVKEMSFEDFCKYLIPYKIVNEQPDDWCSKLQDENQSMLTAVAKAKSSYDACLLVNETLKKQFIFDTFPAQWDLNYSDLNILKSGSCYHATQFSAYLMRAMGIPVVMDFTPFWGNLNGGHEWNALIYDGKPVPFVGGESDPGKTKIDLAFQRKRGKIFRHSFTSQPDNPTDLDQEDVPSFLKTGSNIEDVTSEYIPVSDIAVNLNKTFPEAKYAYISVFNRQKWTPLFWGTINASGNATFRDMGRSIVYLPVYYDSDQLIPASAPVILEKDGSIVPLQCSNSKKIEMTLFAKGPQGPAIQKDKDFELFYWDNEWISMGKQIATSNSVTFKKVPADGLYWIHSNDKTSKERIFTYKNNKTRWW